MEIFEERNKLKKKIVKTGILIYVVLFISSMISKNFGDIAITMCNVILAILDVNMTNRGLILYFLDLAINMFPMFPFIVGEVRLYDLFRQYNELNMDAKVYSSQMRELELDVDKITIQNIVERMKTLSRSKQIELLNYVKDMALGNSIDMKRDKEIESLDKDSLDLLISEVQDIVYPSYNCQQEKDYTRKKIKNDDIMTIN